jgi:hypothetical protein
VGVTVACVLSEKRLKSLCWSVTARLEIRVIKSTMANSLHEVFLSQVFLQFLKKLVTFLTVRVQESCHIITKGVTLDQCRLVQSEFGPCSAWYLESGAAPPEGGLSVLHTFYFFRRNNRDTIQ